MAITGQHQRITSALSLGTTKAQMDVVKAIRQARNRHPAYGPSYRELAAALNVSVNDVAEKVSRLVRDGVLEIDRGIARSLRVAGDE